MSSEYKYRRAAIIKSLRAGKTPNEIIRFFGYPKSTVYDVAHKYAASEELEEGSSTPARNIHVRKKTKRTPELIQRTQDLIRKNPGTSFRKLATVLGVRDTIVRQIVQKDLRLYSEDEMPEDFKLFFPVHQKKCVKEERLPKKPSVVLEKKPIVVAEEPTKPEVPVKETIELLIPKVEKEEALEVREEALEVRKEDEKIIAGEDEIKKEKEEEFIIKEEEEEEIAFDEEFVDFDEEEAKDVIYEDEDEDEDEEAIDKLQLEADTEDRTEDEAED